jgi:hypothetical protein
MVNNNENALKDRDIQCLLEQKGIVLSLRTICNCRKFFNIPNHKEKNNHYYGKNISFSDPVIFLKKNFHKIPEEAGVYELSLSLKANYPNQRSNVIYIGSSGNLRKRIGSYSGNSLKNDCLKKIINENDMVARFCLTGDYRAKEKELLKKFKDLHGALPKANRLI